jgi:hypothetical protein
MFLLTEDEWNSLRFQNETSKRGGRRYLPYAFTQEGVAMLSGLLNSDVAIDANIDIMRAFVAFRQYFLGYSELKQDLEGFKTETNKQIGGIYNVLDELMSHKKELEKPRRRIGFRTSANNADEL